MFTGHPANTDTLRQDQINEGRRRLSGTLGVPQRTDNAQGRRREPFVPSQKPERRQHVPKGHDRILDTAQKSGNLFVVEVSSGVVLRGRLVGRDKFTVTVQTEDGTRKTIYKHAIDLFYEVVPEGTSAQEQ